MRDEVLKRGTGGEKRGTAVMLTDAKVRGAKPAAKAYKLFDAHRMFLFVTTGRSKLWRMNYVFDGKNKTLALGSYPLIGLSEARKKRDQARLDLEGDLNRKDAVAGEHLVPLAPASVEVLRAIAPLTSASKLVFPSTRHMHRPMSENALGYLLNRAGYHGRHVPHGFRAAFSTIMNEWVNIYGREDDRAVIDLMLAHVPHNKVEGAYNRAAYMERRRELAQIWADMLTPGLSPPTALLPLQRKRANGARAPIPKLTGRPQLRLVKG